MLTSALLTVVAAALQVGAAPTAMKETHSIEARQQGKIVPHDTIKYIPQQVRAGVEGDAMLKYEPYLHIASGCDSYPAVSITGEISGGLQASGGSAGKCNDARNGQTYVRGTWHRGRYAIMYAWYFPKDQISEGGANGGHRHDWENVVIWLYNPGNPVVIGAAASAHGGFKHYRGIPQNRNGRLQVEYYTTLPYNHELQFKTSPGWDLDMIDYDKLPDVARNALNAANFGSANCPFCVKHFTKQLDEAWI